MFTFPNPGTTATMEPPTAGMNGRTRLPEFNNGFTSQSNFVGQLPMTGVSFAQPTSVPVAYSPVTGVIPQVPVFNPYNNNPYNYNTVQPLINTVPCTPWAGVPGYNYNNNCALPMQTISPFGASTIPSSYNYSLPVSPTATGMMTGSTIGAIPQTTTNVNPMTSIPTPFVSAPSSFSAFGSFGTNPWINTVPSPIFGNVLSNQPGFTGFGPANFYGQNLFANGLGFTTPGFTNPSFVNSSPIGQFSSVSPFTNSPAITGFVPASPFFGGLPGVANPFIAGIQNVSCNPFLGLNNSFFSGLTNSSDFVNNVCNPFNGTLNNIGLNRWACDPFAGFCSNINSVGFNSLNCNPFNCNPFAIPSTFGAIPQLACNGFCPIC